MKYLFYVWIGQTLRSKAFVDIGEALNYYEELVSKGYRDVRIETV